MFYSCSAGYIFYEFSSTSDSSYWLVSLPIIPQRIQRLMVVCFQWNLHFYLQLQSPLQLFRGLRSNDSILVPYKWLHRISTIPNHANQYDSPTTHQAYHAENCVASGESSTPSSPFPTGPTNPITPIPTDPPTGVPGPTSPKSNTGIIVGGVVGGIALIGIIGLVAIFLLRRKRAKTTAHQPAPAVYYPPPQEQSQMLSGLPEKVAQPTTAAVDPHASTYYGSGSMSPATPASPAPQYVAYTVPRGVELSSERM
jgi:hypothetical protein